MEGQKSHSMNVKLTNLQKLSDAIILYGAEAKRNIFWNIETRLVRIKAVLPAKRVLTQD